MNLSSINHQVESCTIQYTPYRDAIKKSFINPDYNPM